MRQHDARIPFHALRSAMTAGAVVTLAAYAHALAGGQLPATGILLAVLALTGLACTAATRFRLGSTAMTGVLGAGQYLLHEAFTVLGGPLPPADRKAFSHHPAPAAPATGLFEHIVPAGPDSSFAALMLAGHVLATLACGLLLAKGEDALWSLAAWLRPLFRLPEPGTREGAVPPAPGGWPAGCAPRPWRNLRPDCRRGPPRTPAS